MSEEFSSKVNISLEKEMIFKCDLGDIKVADCYIDESNVKEIDMLGPNPTKLLGMAILGCLSASFIFCIKKRNLTLNNLKAEGTVIISRNNKGFLRVKKIDVKINTKINYPETLKRAKLCKKMFENYCTITQSVRNGINVNVDIFLN
ncbi:MAG: OsmC family protein [Promethearchaeota archaeon]